MRKRSVAYLAASFIILSLAAVALAQNTGSASAGITPDSPLYIFKTLKENIQTFFTFGAENKAKQFLRLADVRMAEYQKMLEKGKTEIAQKTLDKYEKQLSRSVSKMEELKNKGKDVKDISERVADTTAKHIEILERNLEKVPEQAKQGIEKALENARKATKREAETTNWKTYKNEQHGFEVKYPLELAVSSMGPNEEQIRIEKGEQISGTIPPSFDTTIFFKEDSNEKFRIVTYYPPTAPLNSNYGIAGTCGSRFAEENLINRVITINGIKFLERRQLFRENKIIIDYCFASGTNNLVTLRSANIDPVKVDEIDKLLRQILSTFRFIGAGEGTENSNTKGIIGGSLGYPSDFIPPDMKICAENIETEQEYCTNTHIKDGRYKYGEGYKIEVPSGAYYVYAAIRRGDLSYKAYYSKFVTCGLKADCPSHDPIVVKVDAGQIISGVDPQDWYK